MLAMSATESPPPEHSTSDEPQESPSPPALGENDELASVARWRDRLRLHAWPRFLLLALGIAALMLGGVNAWRAESSTTLVIVGAVLVIFALVLAPDWREIHLSHGETKASILRDVDQALERVESSSASEQVRQEIAEIRARLDEAADRERAKRNRQAPRPLSATPSASVFLKKPEAAHTFVGQDSVHLTLHVPKTRSGEAYTCTVIAPDGTRLSKSVAPPPFAMVAFTVTFSTRYPDEFPESARLIPGRYSVEWRRGGPASSDVDALFSLAQQLATPPVATDSFNVRGNGGATQGTETGRDEAREPPSSPVS